MTVTRTVGVAVAAALLGAAGGYALARHGGESQPQMEPERNVNKVTQRQVKAARIAVKSHQRLGRPVPPGLQRIADARPRKAREEEYRSYARPELQTPQGPSRRRMPRPAERPAG